MPDLPDIVGPYYAVCRANSGPNGSGGVGLAIVEVFVGSEAAQQAEARAEELSSLTPFVAFYVAITHIAYRSQVALPPEVEEWGVGGSS
jgi:hypothetical protein